MIHSYPWYIKDWLLSETRLSMTLAERGLYRDMLDIFFEHGSLPTQPELIRKSAACQLKEFRKSFPNVRKQFYEKDGRLYNEKAEVILANLLTVREKKVLAGSIGGTKKAQNRAIENVADATIVLEQKSSSRARSTTTTTSNTESIEEELLFTPPTPSGVGHNGSRSHVITA